MGSHEGDQGRTPQSGESTKRISESVILGAALVVLAVMMIDAPSGIFGHLLRGDFLVVGLCLLLRAFTTRMAPRFDQVVARILVVLSVTALTAALLGTFLRFVSEFSKP